MRFPPKALISHCRRLRLIMRLSPNALDRLVHQGETLAPDWLADVEVHRDTKVAWRRGTPVRQLLS